MKQIEAIKHYTLLHWVVIKVLTKQGPYGEQIEFLKWDGLRPELIVKYNWYFNYRAALCQVKNPKCLVEQRRGFEPATPKRLSEVYKGKITAKKRVITETDNKIKKAEKMWTEIFPIEEHPLYAKAKGKLARLKYELAELEEELKKNC